MHDQIVHESSAHFMTGGLSEIGTRITNILMDRLMSQERFSTVMAETSKGRGDFKFAEIFRNRGIYQTGNSSPQVLSRTFG